MEYMINFITNNMAVLWLATLFLTLVLIVLVVILLINNRKLSKKYTKFMLGKTAENLEESFFKAYESINKLQQEDLANKNDIQEIKKVMTKTYQRMAVIHYNAFPGMGGNASSVIALLTQSLDGVILNIVHSRESCYTYVKTVHNAEPDVLLGEEEKKALDEALKEKPII